MALWSSGPYLDIVRNCGWERVESLRSDCLCIHPSSRSYWLVTLICLGLCFLICKMGLIILYSCFEWVLRTHSAHGKDYIIVCYHHFFHKRYHWWHSVFLWDAGTSYWLYNWELRNVIEANVGIYKKLVIHYDLIDHESWSYILEERKDCVSFSILNSGWFGHLRK